MTQATLLPIGQRVTHFKGGADTHGKGTIVAYNGIKPDSYAAKNPVKAAGIVAECFSDPAIKGAMLGALTHSFYDGTRCPYVILWDPRNDGSEIALKYPNGYKDVYEPGSIEVIPGEIVAV